MMCPRGFGTDMCPMGSGTNYIMCPRGLGPNIESVLKQLTISEQPGLRLHCKNIWVTSTIISVTSVACVWGMHHKVQGMLPVF